MKKIIITVIVLLATIFGYYYFIYRPSKDKPSSILGKWKSTNNIADNSTVFFTISDSTILTEFDLNESPRKVLYSYKILTKKDNWQLIETKNPFGIYEIDTFRIEKSQLKITTRDNKTLILSNY